MKRYLLLLVGFKTLCFSVVFGQDIIVQPYLQNASPDAIRILWGTRPCNNGLVFWGLTDSLGNTTTATSEQSKGTACIHTASLEGLQPATTYFYQVGNATGRSASYTFRTPPSADSESSINLVAISDMQKDVLNPRVFEKVTNEGIIKHLSEYYNGSLNENLQLILIPGDLVADGNNHSEWVNDFFEQGANLFSYVPLYPVPGNHEYDADYFFKYFDLPENGSPGYLEHWWYKDVSNVRIIGMDSNPNYRISEQLQWLDSILYLTKTDTIIDFVFAQIHHPHQSELWPVGNTDYTGHVIEHLEAFTATSGKPSIHFFGHTHGYARGQSRDHQHLMVNVASAGGNIDYWNEYAQIDYPKYTISTADYGYVIVEVDAGAAPQFTLKRFSLGDEGNDLDNVLRDSITIKVQNLVPNQPMPVYPQSGELVDPDGFILVAGSFNDPDQEGQNGTQWQISTACNDFSDPTNDTWVQHENWYKGVNSQADDNLQDVEIYNLLPNTSYCWRVRYRDKSLGWSDWSNPVSFLTDTAFTDLKLYPNPLKTSSTLNLPYPDNQPLEIRVYNKNGQLVRRHTDVFPPVFRLEKENLGNDVYYLHVLKDAERLKVIKFVVVHDG